VQAAKAGGMDCAAVGEAVKCKLADYQLSTFSQLLEAVKNSTKGACTKEWKQNF
jgi:beta-phosphoglucomutase